MSTTSQSEPKFPPDISFGKTNLITAFEAYIIDGDTIRDILAAVNPNTATQAFRMSRIREILEEAKRENVVEKPNSTFVFGDE
jgi:hypothetical protein